MAFLPGGGLAAYRDKVITSDPLLAWCLVKGEWVELRDPVMAACDPDGGDVFAAMTQLGYEAWCQVGAEDFPWSPVTLALYSRDTPPLQFLLQLEGNAGDVVEHVFAESLPDAMELLAKWAPIAQSGAVVELIQLLHADEINGRAGRATRATTPPKRPVPPPSPGGVPAPADHPN